MGNGHLSGSKCRICGNTSNNRLYDVKERQLNKGASFQYMHCGRCGTLQLVDKVENIGEYYEDSYYSFQVKSLQRRDLPMLIKKLCVGFVVNCLFWLPGSLENFMREHVGSLMILYGTKIRLNSAVLDVGGQWQMA